jgi:membrane protein implicated in regulation of membrane protease activity
MANWYKFPTSLRITEDEYRANINGMNIVFGAVLGFVLARAEGLPPTDFITVLFISALAVILILYLGTTEYILFYGACTALVIFAIPWLLSDQFKINPIPYLQPTLIAWASMVAALELTPRVKRLDTQPKEPQ